MTMTMRILERDFPHDHLPLLRWLIFTGVTVFGFALAWHFGLIHLMLASDKTYISAIIGVLYIATAMPSLIRPIEFFTDARSAESSPAIGASIRMKPMMVPRSPSFISASLANEPS